MGWVVNATPTLLHPRERPGTHCVGGWVGRRAGLDGCGESGPPPMGFDPRTVQYVASRYTDSAQVQYVCVCLYVCIYIYIYIYIYIFLYRHSTDV